MSNREPERNNFTDNYNYPFPKAEHVNDYELGYQYSARSSAPVPTSISWTMWTSLSRQECRAKSARV